jgi:uncharacterized protein (TIGR02677 family)
VRTLTVNLTRLSRSGVGTASRRADFLRLAQLFDRASPDDTHRLAAAAFGLTPANHYGERSADSADPVAVSTSWWQAPRAEVALSLRERGETGARGRTSPMPDRSHQRELLAEQRARQRASLERVDYELLDVPVLDGRSLSALALRRVQEVIGRTMVKLGTRRSVAEHVDGRLRCRIERSQERNTRIHVEGGGTLTLLNLTVSIRAASERSEPTELDRAG